VPKMDPHLGIIQTLLRNLMPFANVLIGGVWVLYMIFKSRNNSDNDDDDKGDQK
jgi:hypothetical protein